MRLSFKKTYIAPIQQGTKTTTLRKDKPRFGVGERVSATCRYGDPPFAELVVTAVELVDVEAITDECARADGYPNAAALREAVGKTYPGVRWLWQISFDAEPWADTRTSE